MQIYYSMRQNIKIGSNTKMIRNDIKLWGLIGHSKGLFTIKSKGYVDMSSSLNSWQHLFRVHSIFNRK